MTFADYYPFGMPMPGRKVQYGSNRFGFNGKEEDDEVYGDGNYIDFGARAYDSRIARWTSKDPLARKYPSLSPYQFANNSPIVLIDPDGKKIVVNNTLTSNSSKFEDARVILNNYFGIKNLVTIQGDNIVVAQVNTDKMTIAQRGVYNLLYSMSSVPRIFRVNVTDENPNSDDPFEPDDYATSTLYISNLKDNKENAKYMASNYILYHFFKEQQNKQIAADPLAEHKLKVERNMEGDVLMNDGDYMKDHNNAVMEGLKLFEYQYTRPYINEKNTDVDILDKDRRYIITLRSHKNDDGTYKVSSYLKTDAKPGDIIPDDSGSSDGMKNAINYSHFKNNP